MLSNDNYITPSLGRRLQVNGFSFAIAFAIIQPAANFPLLINQRGIAYAKIFVTTKLLAGP